MEGILASTENLVIQIWEQLKPSIKNANGELVKIKLVETENNFVEYFGGNEPY
jgi:6-pyruvoyltetrahydropterin/6-carboxytetrahydropterin synthase